MHLKNSYYPTNSFTATFPTNEPVELSSKSSFYAPHIQSEIISSKLILKFVEKSKFRI